MSMHRPRVAVQSGMVALLVSLVAPAIADELSAVQEDCVGAIAADPENALDSAARWARLGGGAPARLCEAAALEAVGALAVAAERLTVLGQDLGVVLSAEARAIILTDAATLWLDAGTPKLAEASVTAALTLRGGTPRRLHLLARALGQQARWEEAAAVLSAHVLDNPEDAAALALLAAARRRMGQAEDALNHARAARALAPDLAEARFEEAAALIALGRKKEAAPLLVAFIDVHPDHDLVPAARALLVRQPG